MFFARFLCRPLVLACAAAALAGCQRNDDDSTRRIAVIGAPAELWASSAPLPPAAALIRGATAPGLVSLDEQGQVIPGLADRWVVGDDGLSYLFRLRDGAWPDDTRITAATVQAALRQRLASLRKTSLELDLKAIDGVRVMTGRVLEITLVRPQPDLLQILAQPEMGLVRKGKGAGFMRLIKGEGGAVLSPLNPEKLGLPAVEDWAARAQKVRLLAIDAPVAARLFNAGKLDLVTGGSFRDLPEAKVSALSRSTLQFDPVAGLFGLEIAHQDGFLAEPGNREAIAMAIDRSALAALFGEAGWTPATHILPAGLADAVPVPKERWEDLDMAERRGLALARVSRWRASGHDAPVLRLAIPVGSGADRLFARLRDDLRQIGLDAIRVTKDQPADLRLVDHVARYPHAAWYFNQLACISDRAACSKEADALFADALAASQPEQSAELMAKAAASLEAANVFIPFGPPIRWSMVSRDKSGFAVNPLGYHPLMPLALRPK